MLKRKKQLLLYPSLVLTTAVCLKVIYDTNTFKVNEVDLYSTKLSDGSSIKILQLTDIHNRIFGKDHLPLINRIDELQPDIIVITGDLVDRKTTDLTAMFRLIEKIVTINKHVYFVSGNHEWDNFKKDRLMDGLVDRGVQLMDNTNIILDINHNKLQLAGVADYSTEHDNLSEAMLGLQSENYTLLLSHAPDLVNTLMNESIDLILSGHTHGGQIRIPFIGALVAPDQGYFPELDKGLYQWKPDHYLYIDSGLGTTKLPLRLFNQSQMSLLTIKGKK
ncbi:uncharacterized protein YpbG [Paraliobacillus ryukyuensis]|uniref:Calcineurin-like phosphoesterase domain-containing protein n=1 Tax=Paraliobacillus ryukyuensis TaxID=200904 RepID=A0A366DZH6_9BACI|nr:metallophosphoesterase [Paraliobacillus ryukyuensis]RBO94618.1 hypothetical protein DES48_110105 [Paraliobacillus ryukyuensis]